LDATDSPLHGDQEGRFFQGYYKEYCYLPLYIFCGEHLLCAKQRQANNDGAEGCLEECSGSWLTSGGAGRRPSSLFGATADSAGII